MSTTGLERFNKKFGSAVKRTKKEAKKAAEGHMLKEIADKKAATMSMEEKATKYFKENNIVVPEDEQYTIMTVSFFNKMEQDMRANITAELTKLHTEKDEEEMNAEQIKAIVAEAAAALSENRNKELELQLKLQEAKNRELEIQLEMARLAVQKHLTAEDVEAAAKFEAEAQVEEQFKPKKIRTGKQKVFAKSLRNKVEEVPVNPLEGKLEEVVEPSIFATPVRKGRGGYSVAWKQVVEDGTFIDTVINIVEYATDNGIDAADTNAFRKFHPVCQGAYIQYTKMNKGNKGCWREFINQYSLV